LLVIDRHGQLLGTLANPSLINGPWGMAVLDRGDAAQIFISNVLNGTVTRFDLAVSDDGESLAVINAIQIASGYDHRFDPAALVLGPSGLSYNAQQDILYVASSADNAVYAISGAGSLSGSAGTGTLIYQDNVHLHGPIDLAQTPSGHLVAANSDGSNADPNQPSELVEFTADGQFVAQYSLDPNNGGAFGLAMTAVGEVAVRSAAVDDNTNTLSVWTESIN
jgi:DNA-binding beta-propeller fold protein YncE